MENESAMAASAMAASGRSPVGRRQEGVVNRDRGTGGPNRTTMSRASSARKLRVDTTAPYSRPSEVATRYTNTNAENLPVSPKSVFTQIQRAGVEGSTPKASVDHLRLTYPAITTKDKYIQEEIQGNTYNVDGKTINIEQVDNSLPEQLPDEVKTKLLDGVITWDDELQEIYGDDVHINLLMELLEKQYKEWKQTDLAQKQFGDESYSKFNKLFRAIVANFRAYFNLPFTKLLENMVNLFIQYNKEYGIDLYDIIKKAKGGDVHSITILENFVVNLLFNSTNGVEARRERWKEKNGIKGEEGLWEKKSQYYKYLAVNFLKIIDLMFSFIHLHTESNEYEKLKKNLVYFMCLMLLDYLTPVSDLEHGRNTFDPNGNVINRLVKLEKTPQLIDEKKLKLLKQEKADQIETFINQTVNYWFSISELAIIQYDTPWPEGTDSKILSSFKEKFEAVNLKLIDNLLEYFPGLLDSGEMLAILECVYNFIYVNSNSNGNITNRLIRYMIIFALLIFTCVRNKGTAYNKLNTIQIIREFNENFVANHSGAATASGSGAPATGGKLSKKRNSIKDLEQEVKKLNKKGLSLFKKKELFKEKIKKIDTKLKELDKKRKELGKQYKKNKTKTLKNQIDKIIKSIEKEKINKVNKKKELKKISDEYKAKNKELKNKDNALKKKLKKKGGKCSCLNKV
jgi:hypothetical protein